jgi:hypothetical protein
LDGSVISFEQEGADDSGVAKWHKGFSEQINDVLNSRPRMVMQCCACVFAFIGFVCSSMGNYALWSNHNSLNDAANMWKGCTTVSTVLLCAVIYKAHAYDLRVEILRGYIAPESTVFSSGRHNNFYFELLVCAVHSPIFVHYEFKELVTGPDDNDHNVDGHFDPLPPIYARHSLDSLANVFMTSRLFLLLPLIHHFLGLTGAGPRLVARYTNIIFDMNFTLKAILDKHSYFALFVMIITFSIHTSWCLHVVERTVCVYWDEQQWEVVAYEWGYCGAQQRSTFENLFDSFWHAVVTMTSVGYGDLVPVTYLGRLTSIFSSFLGCIILALLVNVMTDMTTFKARERKAFDLIQRGQYRSKTVNLAATLLQHCWLAHKHHRTGGKTSKWVGYKKKYYITYRKWKANLREILVNENKIDDVAIITTELSGLRRDFKEMLFTSVVDLEDRLDRRMLRLLKEVHETNTMTRRMTQVGGGPGKGVPGSNIPAFKNLKRASVVNEGDEDENDDNDNGEDQEDKDFKRKLSRFVSKLPEMAIKESIDHGAEHVHTAQELEEMGRVGARYQRQHEIDTSVEVVERESGQDGDETRTTIRRTSVELKWT